MKAFWALMQENLSDNLQLEPVCSAMKNYQILYEAYLVYFTVS